MEKIMKAVKSGNKKRGRNITVGAVVGMLLSCTVAMGADVSGLEITKEGDTIIFKDKDGTEFEPGNDKEDTQKDPYLENIWDEKSKTYTNNSIISRENSDGDTYGVKLSGDLSEVSFVNNGTIAGTSSGSSGNGYGIYSDNGTSIGILINNGSIIGTSSGSSGNGYGIRWYSSSGYDTVETLTNNGTIIGTTNSNYGSGIKCEDVSIIKLENNGTIIGINTGSKGFYSSGIYTAMVGGSGITMGILTNNGIIIGTSTKTESSGIYNYGGYIITTLTNTGVIYGKTSAIVNDSEGEKISNAYNYGLLISGDDSKDTVSNVATLTDSNNLGLIFKDVDGKYTATDDDFKKFGTTTVNVDVVVGLDESSEAITEEYTIINAKVDGIDKDNITGTESLTLKNGTLFHEDSDTSGIEDYSSDKNYILNGITDTLLVKGKNR